ncbi:MAG: universal stress protein [Actinobacteria bacterium]|nr:universal stress protein [Actinomycetota bacterium]
MHPSVSPIVVGVDGSAAADAALRFALEEARLRGARLRVVCVWEISAAALAVGPVGEELPRGLERAALRRIDEAVRRCGADRGEIQVERRAVRGPVARALLEAAQDAELVVVGSRGRGGIASLLLGSVGQEVAHHAQIPAIIVPRTNPPPRPPGRGRAVAASRSPLARALAPAISADGLHP